ncbi:hypothetical protein JZ751_014856 [Albula glossodonta]|uniref:NlpC/P60 domain-containing protein n=1 Tax=Albula glossodonta TaxID=121402 RepID=A0A8T2N8C9_9TELE|nr:hypothetical protein JZ751_014856 [Albula glossodonta]
MRASFSERREEEDEFLCRRNLHTMEKLKGQRLMREQAQERLRDPQHRWALRIKFLQQVKTYIGVPYSRKYHQPGTAEHESALFLDCCGLVRRAMRDLHQDFGFALGPGNQCYQYDTLPITLSRPQCMRPGDLVFISWTYFSPFMKRQPHDIVHVEVWLGEGEKTVGARWHQGKVQEFPSYQFVSSSYGNMRYHFKSIETWLSGACVSHCRDHRWRLPDDKHNGKSIFSSHHLDQQAVMSSEGWGEPSGPRETGVCGAQEELCLGAVQYNSETKQGLTENFGRRDFAPSNTVGIMLHFNNTRNEQQEAKESKATEGRLSPRKWRSPQEQKGTQVMQLKAKGQGMSEVQG